MSHNLLFPDEIFSSIPNLDEDDSEDILIAPRYEIYKDLEEKLEAEGLMD